MLDEETNNQYTWWIVSTNMLDEETNNQYTS